jgi:acyl-CoA reductase-like NAD-dependent aldehyde dehydrogenase
MNMMTRTRTRTRPVPAAPQRLFIGGQWVEPISNQKLDVISPVTEELILSYPEAGRPDIDRAVAEARDAFDNGPWPRMAPAERAAYLRKVAELITQRSMTSPMPGRCRSARRSC